MSGTPGLPDAEGVKETRRQSSAESEAWQAMPNGFHSIDESAGRDTLNHEESPA